MAFSSLLAESATDPLHGARLNTKSLRYLAHAVGAPRCLSAASGREMPRSDCWRIIYIVTLRFSPILGLEPVSAAAAIFTYATVEPGASQY